MKKKVMIVDEMEADNRLSFSDFTVRVHVSILLFQAKSEAPVVKRKGNGQTISARQLLIEGQA